MCSHKLCDGFGCPLASVEFVPKGSHQLHCGVATHTLLLTKLCGLGAIHLAHPERMPFVLQLLPLGGHLLAVAAPGSEKLDDRNGIFFDKVIVVFPCQLDAAHPSRTKRDQKNHQHRLHLLSARTKRNATFKNILSKAKTRLLAKKNDYMRARFFLP